jgi:glycosyltransferase involved in cell wall biosynthesis
MEKIDVLIFSDCYIYGGSERLMAFLLKNDLLSKHFNFKYSFRNHSDYQIGLENEGLFNMENNYPLTLLSNDTLFHKINCAFTNIIVRKAIKIPFFFLEKCGFYFIWNLVILIILLLRTKPGLIHINNGGYPAAKTCNLMVVANYITINSKIIYQINNQAQFRKYYFEKIYDRFINSNVNCFINASQKAKQELIEKRDFDSDKINLLNNCVILPNVNKSRKLIFKELNIPADSFLIVEVAFLSERKGQRYLIDALYDLYNKKLLTKDKVFCALVGNGEDEDNLKKHIENLGLKSNVFLLGFRTNSEDYISACDLFVLPSIRDEDMPLVLLSALGYGKPIIATNFAGISQVIKSNFNGVLIENNLNTLTSSLSKEIYNIYTNEAMRSQFGVSAKQSFTNYSPEIYGINLKQIYDNIYAT